MQAKKMTPVKSVSISYEEYVIRVVSFMTKEKGAIDQRSLRELPRSSVAQILIMYL